MGVKPIIFSGPMVKAILDGCKTMTRRVIKPQPKTELHYIFGGDRRYIGKWMYPSQYAMEKDGIRPPPEGFTAADRDALWTPPCHGDDILWVRETWAEINGSFVYRADDSVAFLEQVGIAVKWCPSIHMPKAAARIFLRVTNVHIERLQDITGAGIVCEGVISRSRQEFRSLWDSLRKPNDIDKYGWDANPWVWVISFERCEKPEAWDKPRSLAEDMGFVTLTFTGLLQ